MSAMTVSAISSARETSTWTNRRPRSAARAESTARSEEPRQRMSCHGLSRRWAARGRNASECKSTAAADSILPSARRLRPTCSTAATPARESCSRSLSSMQLRVTTKGSCGALGFELGFFWWWDIDFDPLLLADLGSVIDIFRRV
uniref:Uncharacterized protein n=1 Tax=Opuntia streptacantha TaxID=393608 RepID=A0A7C9AKB5_OPUST